jgi:hypothetical protein
MSPSNPLPDVSFTVPFAVGFVEVLYSTTSLSRRGVSSASRAGPMRGTVRFFVRVNEPSWRVD